MSDLAAQGEMPHSFSADAWLSEIMGCQVFKWSSRVKGPGEEELACEMAELAQGGNAFFFAKLPTRDVVQCMALARAGFAVVDSAITLAWESGGGMIPADIKIAAIRPEQHDVVAEIAGSCFRWSRFHLDPHVPSELANLIKRKWIENYCKKVRGDALYVCEVDGGVAGFLAVLKMREGDRLIAVIDLIGVAGNYRKRGIGAALVNHFIQEWQGCVNELRVGTQAANIQSLRLYERHGFRAVDSNYVLHAHYQNGKLCK